MKPSRKRRLRRWSWGLAVFAALFVLLSNRWVINSTDDYIYRDWALLPDNEVGVVLGTSHYTRSGEDNPYFHGRVEAAAELYRVGKVRHLIVSGANPDSSYNEPRRMRKALIELGVPGSAITMDFAGLRTFDSIARMRDVFGLTRATIITQRYHAHRAVFLGRKMGMLVVAYAPGPRADARQRVREVFARVKAILDLYVLRTEPRFLGEPIPLPIPRDGGEAT